MSDDLPVPSVEELRALFERYVVATEAYAESLAKMSVGNVEELREAELFRWLSEHVPELLKDKEPPTTGADLIAAERQRQITDERWSAMHDDAHTDESLALAAAVYAWPGDRPLDVKKAWPWDRKWFKPEMPIPKPRPCNCRSAGDCPHFGKITPEGKRVARIRTLVKAGALIAAEIDRLARHALDTSAAPSEKDSK